jgi:uncharacterized membrane protein (DUF485 family)
MEEPHVLIDRDPRFHALQRARSRFAWGLTAVMLGAHYAFIAVIACAPAWFAAPLHAGTTLTRGIAAGAAIILLAIALTGLYVWRANREFDVENRRILATLHDAS